MEIYSRPPNRLDAHRKVVLFATLGIALATITAGIVVWQTYDPERSRQLPVFPEPSPSPMGQYDRAAVSCDAPVCADIGKDVLLEGGTVVDAGIATLLCMGVIQTQSMGVGGGFLMVLYNATTRTSVALTAREKAPLLAFEDMFEGNPNISARGPLAVAVPGELKGYWEMYQRHGGGVPWSRLVQPTITLCEQGFNVSRHAANALAGQSERIKTTPSMAEIFINNATGEVWREGDRMRRPALARTLAAIAGDVDGGNLLYMDTLLMRNFVDDLRDLGGIMTYQDMLSYTKIRDMESQGKQTAVEIALTNPMILTEILQQSSAPLKDCRLVCHFWNDMVLTLPDTRLALRPVKKDKRRYVLNDPFPFFVACITLDDRLAKRISATCSTSLSDPTRCIDSFVTKLIYICDKFIDIVQILEISIDYEECLKTVYQVLKNFCPNLKQLRITATLATRWRNLLVGSEILPESLPEPKSNLISLAVSSNQISPFLSSLIEVIVAASPNLRNVTLPWELCPNFANSKHLDTLMIELDRTRAIDITLEDDKLSVLLRMLAQVGDQLVSLTFCDPRRKEGIDMNDFDNSKLTEFRFPKSMSKLRNFRNEMVDIFQCRDLLRNIESLPVLETLVIGKTSKRSNCVDEIFRSIFHTDKIFLSVKNLTILEMNDPTLLERLKTSFPNLASLEVKTFCRTDYQGFEIRMELGVALTALGRWEGLKRLRLWVPSDQAEMINAIRALLEVLKTFEAELYTWDLVSHELTIEEMDLFKQLLLAMDRMDNVKIFNLSLGDESLKTISAFMVSNELVVSKFKIFLGRSMCPGMD
ncbi:Gamma-glutamyltranspeptidase 1 [Folsomia candida]|uniref:Gamma-glutamyltranspeptidase 1 n=1 Tax=Folsomia candida TaxID=158441 RepID=A0A226ETM2_FOLCA|nr:Gamma-glutamyltranspeptidase 1 [Folsomia candida]